MKISERTIKRLGEIITGDKPRNAERPLAPYRSGPDLVRFFNEVGMNAVYGEGFPSRWQFAEECIRKFNDSETLHKIIVAAFDPRHFIGADVRDPQTQERKPVSIEYALTYLNEFLSFDGYEVVAHGKGYAVLDKTHGEIDVDVKLEPNHLSRAFIVEQIEKCRTKLSLKDYDGAITNARSLIEAVLIAIEKQSDPQSPAYDGDLPKLYKRVQVHLNLSSENPKISDSLKQTLRGLVSIIIGLSSLSNKMGDRHAREFKPAEHHAVLVVNSAMTLSSFIFDTHAYQSAKKLPRHG
jgi:hypothetical protein